MPGGIPGAARRGLTEALGKSRRGKIRRPHDVVFRVPWAGIPTNVYRVL